MGRAKNWGGRRRGESELVNCYFSDDCGTSK